METKKRLSEWTLAECKEYCGKRTSLHWYAVGRDCEDCVLEKVCGTNPGLFKFDTLTSEKKESCGLVGRSG